MDNHGMVPQTNLQLYAQLAAWPADARRRVREAHDLARLLFSARYRSCGKPFLAHLVGTAGLLAAHGADRPTVCAGLLHAAYLQGDFGAAPRAGRRARRRVARAVGAEAEALVWQYAGFRWEEAACADRRVLAIRLANELEELHDLGVLHAAEGKRAAASCTTAQALAAADAAGEPFAALAAALRAARDRAAASVVPAELVDAHDASFTIAPPSYGRRLWPRAAGAVRRLLGRSARTRKRGDEAIRLRPPGVSGSV